MRNSEGNTSSGGSTTRAPLTSSGPSLPQVSGPSSTANPCQLTTTRLPNRVSPARTRRNPSTEYDSRSQLELDAEVASSQATQQIVSRPSHSEASSHFQYWCKTRRGHRQQEAAMRTVQGNPFVNDQVWPSDIRDNRSNRRVSCFERGNSHAT